MNVVPYFTFAGNCREVMNFYKDALQGETLHLQTFAEAGMQGNEVQKDWIIHAELKAGDLMLMASDGMTGFQAQPGNTISLMLNMPDAASQDRVFAALSQGGQVTMPLQDTFWGARYGQVTDRFGTQWMLNFQK